MKHSAEWIANKSKGIKAAWQDGEKFKTMRKQSPELIEKRIAPLRGRKVSVETALAISKALTGRIISEEHRAKSAKGWLHVSREISPESESKRRQSISAQRKGCHNYGRAARDRLDHFNALHWIVRDPRGIIHEFDNLQSWCRANEWRFMPDDRPESKLKLWQRAVSGFNNQQRTDKKGSHQWKGWTLVSVLEREEMGAPDLLGRQFKPLLQ